MAAGHANEERNPGGSPATRATPGGRGRAARRGVALAVGAALLGLIATQWRAVPAIYHARGCREAMAAGHLDRATDAYLAHVRWRGADELELLHALATEHLIHGLGPPKDHGDEVASVDPRALAEVARHSEPVLAAIRGQPLVQNSLALALLGDAEAVGRTGRVSHEAIEIAMSRPGHIQALARIDPAMLRRRSLLILSWEQPPIPSAIVAGTLLARVGAEPEDLDPLLAAPLNGGVTPHVTEAIASIARRYPEIRERAVAALRDELQHGSLGFWATLHLLALGEATEADVRARWETTAAERASWPEETRAFQRFLLASSIAIARDRGGDPDALADLAAQCLDPDPSVAHVAIRYLVHERREPRPDLALPGIRAHLEAVDPEEARPGDDWIPLLGFAGTIDDVARLRPYLASDARHAAALAILQILGRDARGR